jgi:hypothetical protein
MAVLGDRYSIPERQALTKAIPEELRNQATFNMYLDYRMADDTYRVIIRQPGKHPKTIRVINRSEMKDWTNPRRVMSYVARRALKDAGFTVDFRRP